MEEGSIRRTKRTSVIEGKMGEDKIDKMHCPKCGKENSEDARFCMHCGRDFSEHKVEFSPKIEVSPAISSTVHVGEEANKYCFICSKEAVAFCPKCLRKVCDYHYEANRTMCTICAIESLEARIIDLDERFVLLFFEEIAKFCDNKGINASKIVDKMKNGDIEGFEEELEKAGFSFKSDTVENLKYNEDEAIKIKHELECKLKFQR